MRSASTKGFTAYICFGPYAGFGLRTERLSVGVSRRVVLGWVSVCVATFDIEQFIGIAGSVLAAREVKE